MPIPCLITAAHPIPPKSRRPSTYKWSEMQIGESFLVKPGTTIDQACSLAAKAAKRTGFKFRCATTDEGVRVWRIDPLAP